MTFALTTPSPASPWWLQATGRAFVFGAETPSLTNVLMKVPLISSPAGVGFGAQRLSQGSKDREGLSFPSRSLGIPVEGYETPATTWQVLSNASRLALASCPPGNSNT